MWIDIIMALLLCDSRRHIYCSGEAEELKIHGQTNGGIAVGARIAGGRFVDQLHRRNGIICIVVHRRVRRNQRRQRCALVQIHSELHGTEKWIRLTQLCTHTYTLQAQSTNQQQRYRTRHPADARAPHAGNRFDASHAQIHVS